MEINYTIEKNAQIVIALLKKHGIRKVIASPGTTNMPFTGSIQNDPYFEVYSSVDERSAAYLACGLAAETGEPVVISCTGATASRNYLPGLTEAFYRKLPVLAITSTQNVARVGHLIAQVIDRSVMPKDAAKLSIQLPIIRDGDDFWECEVKVNQAILELNRHGGGPVHLNLPTTYNSDYTVKELPDVRLINRITVNDTLPKLPEGNIAIFVGSHKEWTENETISIDNFCASNNAVVFCDHTSGYKGKYRVQYALVAVQKGIEDYTKNPDLIIQIGEVSGDYHSQKVNSKTFWRISEDGTIKDNSKKLQYIFEMAEKSFFDLYSKDKESKNDKYLSDCIHHRKQVMAKIPDIPFSNIWIASQIAHKIPENTTIHFAILNSLRAWNFYDLPSSVKSSSNVGGFGIDGCLSSLIGASLADPKKLYFGVIGDLAFFYDMNVFGNRHVKNNIRILLINNGKGTEFRNNGHIAYQFGINADEFIAASGHFGNKSKTLVKGYSESLGYEYLKAENKDEFATASQRFLTPEITDRSMILEVFTNSDEETNALEMMMDIVGSNKETAKDLAKQVLGKKGLSMLKKIINK